MPPTKQQDIEQLVFRTASELLVLPYSAFLSQALQSGRKHCCEARFQREHQLKNSVLPAMINSNVAKN